MNSVRSTRSICRGLEFIGIHLHIERNGASAPIISSDGSPATVRVIATDEEWIIAKTVCRVLGLGSGKE
jgi:acetate kinase